MLDYFPSFLRFLTALIKLILWLKFFYRQEAGRGHGVCPGNGPEGPAPLQELLVLLDVPGRTVLFILFLVSPSSSTPKKIGF